jgi:hypothetical protein
MSRELVDSLLLKKEDALSVSLFLLDKKMLDNDSAKTKAEKGFVPSGFQNQEMGLPRISWVENHVLAKALLSKLDSKKEEVKKETKKEGFFDRGGTYHKKKK